MRNRFWYKNLGRLRFGVETSRVQHNGVPYLDRYILYVGRGTLRLHKFWRGDDDRAHHCHPWWFVTVPFVTYVESVMPPSSSTPYLRRVRAWRPHFRSASFRHIVVQRDPWWSKKPFWTFVMTGGRSRSWGFWRTNTDFTPWREWDFDSVSEQRPGNIE